MTQETTNKHSHDNGSNGLLLTIEGKQYKWDEQYITGAQIKHLSAIPLETEIFLSVKEPWKDELISNNDTVNLARPEVEHFYCKKLLQLIIDQKEYEWGKQYISAKEIRALGNIANEDQLFLSIKSPWDDELIDITDRVDLARPGIEHFYSKKKEQEIVTIQVNNVERKIKRGSQQVAEIKKVGEVPAAHELEQLIDGKLVLLADNASVIIKGCEQFFSHVRDGSSS